MNRLNSWGESMYGGYYAQVWVENKYEGFHADKLKELKAQLKEIGVDKLDNNLRQDN